MIGAADWLWTLMATSLEAMPGLLPFRQDSERSIRETLGSEMFDALYAEGAAMSWVSAIAYALEEVPSAARSAAAQDDRASFAVLTKREQQVAELVAAGLSNQDIASRLVISRRTAETHVENILTKLGFTSRTQVAVWNSERLKPSR